MDGEVDKIVSCNRNMLVPWYLILSHAYYNLDESLVSDGLYDRICKDLDTYWGKIEHRHKHIVQRDYLSAGTGYYLSPSLLPIMVKSATVSLIEHGIMIQPEQKDDNDDDDGPSTLDAFFED